jgi:hypothetical protein
MSVALGSSPAPKNNTQKKKKRKRKEKRGRFMELSKGRLVGNVQNKQLVSSEFILTSMKATL